MHSSFISLLLIIAISGSQANPIPCTGCTCCAANLITKSLTGAGAHKFATDVIKNDGQCSVRTFTCIGKQANIEVNDDGVIEDLREARFEVTCNAAGTAWEAAGIEVRKVECASVQ